MKHRKSMLVGIIIVLVLIIGISVTYAYFTSGVKQEGEGSRTDIQTARIEDTTLTLEGNITSGVKKEVYPGHKEIVELKVTATGEINTLYNLVWKGTNTLKTTFKYEVYKTTSKQTPSITCTKENDVIDGSMILYEGCTNNNFENLGEVISRGTIESREIDATTKLIRNERLQATKEGNTVYYYVVIEYPNIEDNQNLDKNGTFNGITTVDILKEEEYCTNETCDKLLAKNEMVHEIFEDNGSIVDTGYRYEGATPNNYVTFNNELWRIIGVFEVENSDTKQTESLVKIIRNESIGEIYWDTSDEIDDDGLNDWTQSDIKTILNGQYYNGEDINYTYRNPDNSYISTNPIVSILGKSINNESRNMIQNSTWYLGGVTDHGIITSEFYKLERGTEVYGNNQAEWNGYIGLMYPSDYGYSIDSKLCSREIETYDCYPYDIKTWMFNNNQEWTITTYSSHQYVIAIDKSGDIMEPYPANRYGVRPTLYLKSNVSIVDNGKDGSESKPYDLVLN